jgi:hypothetical protein
MLNIIFLNKLLYFVIAYICLYLRCLNSRNLSNVGFVIILYCIFNLYVRNIPKLDIITYREVIDLDYYFLAFEPGFSFLIWMYKMFFAESKNIVFAIQVSLAVLYLTYFGFFVLQKSNINRLERLLLVALSVVFILGVNNNLRQGFAALFLIWIIDIIIDVDLSRSKKIFRAILLLIIAISFHRSSAIFFIYFSFFIFFYNILRINHLQKILVIMLVNILLALSLQTILELFAFTAYDNVTLTEGRLSVSLKIYLYLLMVICLTIIFRRLFTQEILALINYLRFSLAFLALVICITTGSGELASRLFFFCLAIDLYLVISSACKNNISYSIISGMTGILAINSINIWVL